MITSEENLLLLLVVSAPFFGSFISTLLIRLERKKSILKPIFSTCQNCDQRLLLKHKLPILSYIILKGSCYRCKTPISSIYIMLETGFFISTSLAILILFNESIDKILFTIFLAWIFLPLSVFDIQQQRLPDLVTIPLACAGLLQGYFLPYVTFFDCLLGFILGFVLSAVVSILYSKLRGRTGLGWGDVKLIAAVGALIGWQLVPWFIFLASATAMIYVIVQMIIRGGQAGKERIPFGPFLCGCSWLVWIYSIS